MLEYHYVQSLISTTDALYYRLSTIDCVRIVTLFLNEVRRKLENTPNYRFMDLIPLYKQQELKDNNVITIDDFFHWFAYEMINKFHNSYGRDIKSVCGVYAQYNYFKDFITKGSIDYKLLLTKYIDLVGECEGANFISRCNTHTNYFSSDEINELNSIDENITCEFRLNESIWIFLHMKKYIISLSRSDGIVSYYMTINKITAYNFLISFPNAICIESRDGFVDVVINKYQLNDLIRKDKLNSFNLLELRVTNENINTFKWYLVEQKDHLVVVPYISDTFIKDIYLDGIVNNNSPVITII